MTIDAPLRHTNTLVIDDGTQSSSRQAQAGRPETQARCGAVKMRGTVQHLFPNLPL
jgi:hypothetical protein